MYGQTVGTDRPDRETIHTSFTPSFRASQIARLATHEAQGGRSLLFTCKQEKTFLTALSESLHRSEIAFNGSCGNFVIQWVSVLVIPDRAIQTTRCTLSGNSGMVSKTSHSLALAGEVPTLWGQTDPAKA